MKLLIDAQPLQTGSRQRGIGRYAANLIAAVVKARPGWDVALVQNARLPAVPDDLAAGRPVLAFHPPLPLDGDDREHAAANEAHYADWLNAAGADRVLLTSCFELAVLPRFFGPRPGLAAVVYDLIPLLFSGDYLRDPRTQAWYASRLRLLLQADALLAISESTANDLAGLCPDRRADVTVIGGATDPAFRPLGGDELAGRLADLRGRLGTADEFALYVGGSDLRKNMPNALRAYAALSPAERGRLDFVIACYLEPTSEWHIRRLAESLGVADRVRLTGLVTDEELTALYQACRVFFFPSLYEGLGLPVLEALRCGAPVVASDRSSLPEYAGPASWLADPTSPEALADALRRALAEPRDARRAERVAWAGRFTWARAAGAAADAIAAGRRTVPAAPRAKPRVAWVSPLPPAPTGVADYSADLVPALAGRFDLELVVGADRRGEGDALAARFPVLTADEALARHDADPYDLFVYHLGNNAMHHDALPLMARHRGVVVLHDVYLGGLVSTAAARGLWPTSLLGELEAAGETLLADLVREGHVSAEATVHFAPVHDRLLHAAEAVVVHSAWAWRRVRAAYDGACACVPMAVPVPEVGTRADERRRLGLPADAFVVVTLGHVARSKRIGTVLRAAARLPDAGRVMVAVVGPGPEGELDRIRRLAGELGMADRVRLTGSVPLADLTAYARAADVCAQLRYPSHGETSASLLRAMAAGAACVTSEGGPADEFPPEAVRKVRSPARDEGELAAALAEFAADPAARDALGERAMAYVRDRHAPAAVAARYALVLEGAVAARRARDAAWQEVAAGGLAALPDPAGADAARAWAGLRLAGTAAAATRAA